VAIQPTAQMMTDWLCRQGEQGKIELEDTQAAVEMLRGMMVMDTQRAIMLGQRAVPDQAEITGTSTAMCTAVSEGSSKQTSSMLV
jgi:hypothetical protein